MGSGNPGKMGWGQGSNPSSLVSSGYGAGGAGSFYQSMGTSGGSGGGAAIKTISNLTPGSTIAVTVGAEGAAGTTSYNIPGNAGTQGIVIVEW